MSVYCITYKHPEYLDEQEGFIEAKNITLALVVSRRKVNRGDYEIVGVNRVDNGKFIEDQAESIKEEE